MKKLTPILAFLLFSFFGAGTLYAQSPYPITVLVLEGDTVTGVGNVTRIDNLAVNNNGDWLVEADTDHANTDLDTVLLLNGVLHLREGDSLSDPPLSNINSFDSINLNINQDSGWNFFLSGPPSNADSGIYFNTTLVIQESDISTAPEFESGTVYLGFFDAKMNDFNKMITVASVDQPTNPDTVERALVLIVVDNTGKLISESALIIEDDILPGQTEAVAELGTGPHQSALNQNDKVLIFVDLAGSTATDGVIYLDDSIVAQEGDPSPVAGRNYEILSSRGMDLNNFEEVAYKANLDGDASSDEMIVRDGTELIREGQSLPAIAPNKFTSFGIGSGPIQIDDNRNVLWYGDWDDPNTDIDTGLFLNETLLVQEGVTKINGLIVDTIYSGSDGFTMSENGRYIAFEATLEDTSEGAFMIEIQEPYPVPDGHKVPGTQMTASKNGPIDIDVTWDVTTCPNYDYNLFYGKLSDVSTYTYFGAECSLGISGTATFTPPSESIFWIIAGVDSTGIEGTHGFDSLGQARSVNASGACSVTSQINSSSCP
jgi:hypothetical protein